MQGRLGRHGIGIVTIAFLLLGSAFTARPVAAGGWAMVELDAWPDGVIAGKPVAIGFRVLQHGFHPVEMDAPRLVATHRATGERIHSDGTPEGATGHYVATVTFPLAGEWKWSISSQAFASATAFETLEVERWRPESSTRGRWNPGSPFAPATTGPSDAPRAGTTDEPIQVQVKIDDVGFSPAHMEVPRGTTVAWVNGGVMPHQIMGVDLAFEDSNLLRTGETVTRTFTEPGTYTYLCGPHQDMIGTITVK